VDKNRPVSYYCLSFFAELPDHLKRSGFHNQSPYHLTSIAASSYHFNSRGNNET
jgi:hypothetical protein